MWKRYVNGGGGGYQWKGVFGQGCASGVLIRMTYFNQYFVIKLLSCVSI